MKTDRMSKFLKTWRPVLGLVLAMALAAGIGAGQVYGASCIAIDDIPLDTQETSAPGIVMVIVDDSGSMDWEVVCKGSNNGVFDSAYEYLFANPGDNLFGSGETYGTILEGSSAANKWKSQWAGHNRLYYDPSATYTPWPGYAAASPNTPRSNPVNATPTLDMGGTYHDFGSAGALTAQDILEAGGAIVDNSNISGAPLPELIMDNRGPVVPATGSFSTAGSSANAWTTGTSRDYDYGSDYLYSASTNKWDVATWSYTNLLAGPYDVYVWYVADRNRSTSVNYKVYNASGTEVASKNFDQERNGGTWNLLASSLNLDGSASVQLRHYCTSTSNRACADAVKLVPRFSDSSVLFTSGTGWSSQTSASQYGTNYLFSYGGSMTYTATWTANNLDPAKTYTVYARWVASSSRSTSVVYKTYDGATDVKSTTVNQQINGGTWIPIAEEVTFSSGTGSVKINQAGNNGYFCADAVAFMPGSFVAPPKVVRAHYYVVVNDIPYLVNLDGTIQYYKVKDLDSDDNVDSADELIKLTDDEALAAGIVTRRRYDEERQNFANWYSFYRRREFTAKNAVAKMLQDMQGVYVGIHCINGGLKSAIRPVRVTLNNVLYDESPTLISTLYAINSSGSTPLRTALNNIGRYFKGLYGKPATMPSTYFSTDSYPFFKSDLGGSCQQAFTILTTDGYWNDSFTCDDHDGDGYSNTLADVAMYYYKTDLNTSLNDNVPIGLKDSANWQHMVTYSLSFGLDGTITQSDYPNCSFEGGCPAWPQPVADSPKAIDDLWHAAVNGRGKYVNAASPMEVVEVLNSLRQDIESRLGSAAALATNSIQRQVGTVIYQGTYNTAGWTGELSALPVNVLTGVVGDPLWRASNHIPDWNVRRIISYDGSSGIDFRYSNLTATQISVLGSSGYDVEKLVNFIRGDTSNTLTYGGPFRNRIHPMGDIIHSSPYYYKGMVYIGANDGMLHAVDAATGQERFCYVPNIIYDHLAALAAPGYTHKYYVDMTPVVARVGSDYILVCALGKGGKGVFALDVTSPDEPVALWEFAGDNDLGYTFSQPTVVPTADPDNPYVAVFGNGYDSANQSAVLFVINPVTGMLLKKIYTLTTDCNGLSSPAVVDVEGDGPADFVYAGDLKGNMWKFDIRGPVSGWKVYYQAGTVPKPLITFKNEDGLAQPVTVAPEAMLDCSKSSFARSGNGVMVILGTGRYLNSSDFSDNTVQSLYGIWDWGDIWENREGYDVAKTKYLGVKQADHTLSNVSGKTLLEQTLETDGEGGQWVSNNTISWYDPVNNIGQHMGWFYDLPIPGERGIREPLLRMGAAIFISVIPSKSPCEAGGSSMLYQLSACSGGWPETNQFKDEHWDPLQPPPVLPKENILFEPIEIADKLYLSDSEGDVESIDVPANTLGMQYWRIIE